MSRSTGSLPFPSSPGASGAPLLSPKVLGRSLVVCARHSARGREGAPRRSAPAPPARASPSVTLCCAPSAGAFGNQHDTGDLGKRSCQAGALPGGRARHSPIPPTPQTSCRHLTAFSASPSSALNFSSSFLWIPSLPTTISDLEESHTGTKSTLNLSKKAFHHFLREDVKRGSRHTRKQIVHC